MCGFAAIIYRDLGREPSRTALEKGAALLRHRGPDGSGIFSEGSVGIAARRLSLLDLHSRSDQPFCDESGRYVLAYNGEIYNHRSLRSDLEREGASFRTTSDTEVLLELLKRRDPEAALASLRGMFSFVFYDRQTESCLLARDRFGYKPLWEYRDGEKTIYASEYKAFKPWVDPEPDLLTISSFLIGTPFPTINHTFYENTRIVPPGTVIRVPKEASPTSGRFFSVEELYEPTYRASLESRDDEEIVDTAEEFLTESVAEQLDADAPVASFCSGGVDSSLISCLAARQSDGIRLFHAEVKGEKSEIEAARAIAGQLDAELEVRQVQASDFIRYLPVVVSHFEHPITYHPNSIPYYLISRRVGETGVKGVLSGEGADECVLGYPRLAAEPWFDPVRKGLRGLVDAISSIPKVGKHLVPTAAARVGDRNALLGRSERSSERARIREVLEAAGGMDRGNYETVELLTYHLRTLLHRNDTLGMAGSIESRFPFLDYGFVRFAVNLPLRYKLRYSPTAGRMGMPFVIDKWVIRQVARRHLPESISLRKKRGFPTDAYERMVIPDDFLGGVYFREVASLTSAEIDHLLRGLGDAARRRLFHLEVWSRVCLFDQDPETLGEELEARVRFEN